MQFFMIEQSYKELALKFPVSCCCVWYVNCDYDKTFFPWKIAMSDESSSSSIHGCWLHRGNFKFVPSLKNSHAIINFNEFPWCFPFSGFQQKQKSRKAKWRIFIFMLKRMEIMNAKLSFSSFDVFASDYR